MGMEVHCEICGRSVPVENFVTHELACKRNATTCTHCGKKLTKKELDQHIEDARSFNKAVTAALTGYHGQVRAYLEHGGDPNRREQNGGTTLLHAAIQGGSEKICYDLLAAGARKDAVNALFDTPFQLAMKLPKEKKLSVPMMLALQPVSEAMSPGQQLVVGKKEVGISLPDIRAAKQLQRSSSLGNLLDMFPSLRVSITTDEGTDRPHDDRNEGESSPREGIGLSVSIPPRGHSSDISSLTPEKSRKCPHCGKNIPKENFELHTNFCSRNFETCDWCSASIKKGELQQHMDSFAGLAITTFAKNGDFDGVYNAILHGADVNIADNSGDTPLHHAMRTGSDALVRLLIKSGAEKSKRNVIHSTPWDVASLAMKETFLEDFSEETASGSMLAPPRPGTARIHRQEPSAVEPLAVPGRSRRLSTSSDDENLSTPEISPEVVFSGSRSRFSQSLSSSGADAGYVFESTAVLSPYDGSPLNNGERNFEEVNNSPLLDGGFVPGPGGYPIAPRPPRPPSSRSHSNSQRPRRGKER